MPTTKTQHDAQKNLILSALPESEFQNIVTSLELVDLAVGDVLWESEETRDFVYFPTTALVCLLYESDEGVSVEVGIAGRQGLLGVATFMADAQMAKRAVVQVAGQAYRMKAKAVNEEFSECGDFQDVCMAYTQMLIAQISQSAICNQLHSVEQRFGRYLLINHDHHESNTFLMTHDQISHVLGVRRESVSLAASGLRDAGLIEYSRGKITLLDRKGLEDAVCECYAVVKEQYDRILAKYLKEHDA